MEQARGQPPGDGDAVDDRPWVERAQRGDLMAFDELVRRHHGRIYALIYHLVGNREDAEDVTQTAFLRAYRALGGFRGTAAFSSWMYRIAVNTALNHLKQRRHHVAIPLPETDGNDGSDPSARPPAVPRTPAKEVQLTELHHKLNEALQALSEKHRTVVILHDIEGLPHEEIARIMGCSVGTVRSRLFYARQLLQGLLSEYVA
jgi:RNA polymerase sigma-70 factor (ECF subfamily)